MAKRKFKLKKRRVVFSKGPIHLVDCDVLMPSGKVLSRQILEHPGAVVIIPEVKPGRYLLIRQFRFAAQDWLWEWPAGGIEAGESLKGAASRECCEEIGQKPSKLRQIVKFYPTPGISGEIMYLFLAQGLKPSAAPCDEDEEIEVREFSLRQIEAMIRRGKICDAKTILGFFYLKQELGEK
jgi:ADP-ribose pyrophosphatase